MVGKMRDCELWVLEFFKRERERERERVAALFWTISPITKVIISKKKKGHLSAIHSFQFFFYNHNGRGEILAWFLKSKTARESEKLN